LIFGKRESVSLFAKKTTKVRTGKRGQNEEEKKTESLLVGEEKGIKFTVKPRH